MMTRDHNPSEVFEMSLDVELAELAQEWDLMQSLSLIHI